MIETQEIKNIIYRFANSFDKKDWDSLQNLLTNNISCDYSDLRNTSQTLSSKEYVQKRIDALTNLKTQHLFSNLEIYKNSNGYKCHLSAYIYRKQDDKFFNTHAIYELELVNLDGNWLIAKIKQTVLWNDGDSSIHIGVKK